MKDLSGNSFGKIGKGDAIHIIFNGKFLCNSREGAIDPDMIAKDVTGKRYINPMHKYEPYKDLMAVTKKSTK